LFYISLLILKYIQIWIKLVWRKSNTYLRILNRRKKKDSDRKDREQKLKFSIELVLIRKKPSDSKNHLIASQALSFHNFILTSSVNTNNYIYK